MKKLFTLLLLIGFANIINAQSNKNTGIASLFKTAHTAAWQNIQQSQVKQKPPAPDADEMTNQLAQQGIRFTENKGQVADLNGKLRPDILFTAHGAGVKLFITDNGIYYQFSRAFEKKKDAKDKIPSKFDIPEVDSTQFSRLDMKLVGAKKPTQIIKEGEGSDYENYYLAHCPNGVLGVKNYNRITFKNIYPNIDWVVYASPSTGGGQGEVLEYDFFVHPGADIKAIKLKYDGAADIKVEEDGGLKVTTPLGTVKERTPVSLQNDNEIKSEFVVKDNIVGFDVKDWDGRSELRIDPSIVWATYYGGNGSDAGYSCSIDGSGNIYLAGYTYSTTGIASGGFQNSSGGIEDAFLVKFGSGGNRLWATYYGGESYDYGFSCTTDASGNVYMAGFTTSTTGIASGGFQNSFGGGDFYDAFLVKFGSGGNRLWATYYGEQGDDRGYSSTTDASGNVYLVGVTFSTTGIASGGFQNSFGGIEDAFLVKFGSGGNRFWATYYGGQGDDVGYDCAIDSLGNVYLAGITSSKKGIASGGFQNSFGGYQDAFLVKFGSGGNRLWATYYGGSSYDEGDCCTTDASGNVYLAGYTKSTTGIASGGFQNSNGGYEDAFLVKFGSGGNRLWATYYGGSSYDEGDCCTTDASGNVYLAGYTKSTTGIASGGFQNSFGGGSNDAFLVKFGSGGNRLWATYYGGENDDDGFSCKTDALGNVYLAGATVSTTGIASGGFQNSFGGGTDAFMVKINECIAAKPIITADKPVINLCSSDSVKLKASVASSYLWSTGATTKSIIVKSAGNYTVAIADSNGCIATSDTTKVTYKTCAKPSGLTAGNITAASARLSWNAVSCAIGYQYEVRKKGTAQWAAAQATAVNKTVTGLSASTTYQWRVITGCKVSPDTITSNGYATGPEFTTLVTEAIAANNTADAGTTNILKATISPNPTTDNTTVYISNTSEKVQLRVTDISGKVLWQSGLTASRSIQMPSQGFAAGTYMVMVKGEKGSVTLKMVKE